MFYKNICALSSLLFFASAFFVDLKAATVRLNFEAEVIESFDTTIPAGSLISGFATYDSSGGISDGAFSPLLGNYSETSNPNLNASVFIDQFDTEFETSILSVIDRPPGSSVFFTDRIRWLSKPTSVFGRPTTTVTLSLIDFDGDLTSSDSVPSFIDVNAIEAFDEPFSSFMLTLERDVRISGNGAVGARFTEVSVAAAVPLGYSLYYMLSGLVFLSVLGAGQRKSAGLGASRPKGATCLA